MIRNRLALVLTAVVLAGFALAGCNRQQDPAATAPPATAPMPAPEEPAAAPASATVTDVQLGTEAREDKTLVEPKTSFTPEDNTIIASVSTATSDPDADVTGRLSARWTYQDGQLVDESSEAFTLSGTGTTNFRITNQEPWPAGTYRVEISLDGEVVESREFRIE